MFRDLRYGLRMLLKQKGFTVVAVLSLALGILRGDRGVVDDRGVGCLLAAGAAGDESRSVGGA